MRSDIFWKTKLFCVNHSHRGQRVKLSYLIIAFVRCQFDISGTRHSTHELSNVTCRKARYNYPHKKKYLIIIIEISGVEDNNYLTFTYRAVCIFLFLLFFTLQQFISSLSLYLISSSNSFICSFLLSYIFFLHFFSSYFLFSRSILIS